MGARVDSSKELRAHNYRGEAPIMEVDTGRITVTPSLEKTLKCAEEKGYIPVGIAIVNIVHGTPDMNEPVAVLYLTQDSVRKSKDAIILSREEEGKVNYQLHERLRFLL